MFGFEIERIPVGDSEIDRLKAKCEKYQDQLLDTRHELVQKDAMVENQKKIIEDLHKVLKRYEAENKAFRELITLWI